MKKTRQDLRSRFRNRMYPDEDDFANAFDSFWHKDDPIDAEKVVQTIDGTTRTILDLIGNNEAMQHILQLQQALSQLTAAVSSKQPIITGAKGEVAYHNGSSVFMQPLMNEGFAVSTPEELQACKDTSPSFEEVYSVIYNLMDSTVLKYDIDTGTWMEDHGKTPVEEIGHGRFSYNAITGRLFYDNGSKILEVANNSLDLEWAEL